MGTETQDPRNGHLSTAIRIACCAVAVVAVCRPGSALAQETSSSYEFGVSGEYSDNIARVPVNMEDETTLAFTTAVDYKRTVSWLDTSLNVVGMYNEYLNNTFDSEFRGNGTLNMEADIVENRLIWFLTDNLGQLRQSNVDPDTPANRENVNILRTGPRLTQNFGARTELVLEASYEREMYETSLLDSTRYGGDLRLRRDISNRQFVGLNATYRTSDYDDAAVYSSYNTSEYFVSWGAEGAKTRLTIDVGQTEISDVGVEEKSLLFRLDASRRIGQLGRLTLTARKDMVGTAEALVIDQQQGPLDIRTQPRNATSEPFDFDYGSLMYEVEGRRFGMSAGVVAERDRYRITTANDRDRSAARLTLTWVASSAWDLGIGGEFAREKFPVIDARFREISYYVSADRQLTRSLSLQIEGRRFDRSGVEGTSAYDENQGRISIVWSGGHGRRGGGAN
jgi:hypothetical protein